MQQELEELKELKEANAKAEADKIRDKDLEKRKNVGEDEMDAEEAGLERQKTEPEKTRICEGRRPRERSRKNQSASLQREQ